MFWGSAYLNILCLHRQKLRSLQRNKIATSSLQDFSNSALEKNTPPKWNMRALHQYAHASCAHICSLCLLGKIFNLSKSFPSLCSGLIPKRVSNCPVEGAAPNSKDCKLLTNSPEGQPSQSQDRLSMEDCQHRSSESPLSLTALLY